MSTMLTNLDDRRWADLVEEGRALIPVYSPEWTDHNVHDPGITLLELFAWIAEGDIYRINRIPDSHRRKFLALVGVYPEPPRGSMSVVTFKTKGAGQPIYLPRHLELNGTSGTGKSVRFRTVDPLEVVPGRLKSIQVYDGNSYRIVQSAGSDEAEEFEERHPFAPFSLNPQKHVQHVYFDLEGLHETCPNLPLTLYFDVDQCPSDDRPPAENDLRQGIYDTLRDEAEDARRLPVSENRDCDESRSCDSCDCCGETNTQQDVLEHHSVRLVWEVWTAAQRWQQVAVVDDTRSLTLSGRLRLTLPPNRAKRVVGRMDRESVYVRCRIDGGRYDAAPRIRSVFMNGVRVQQEMPIGPTSWIVREQDDKKCVRKEDRWLECVDFKTCLKCGTPQYRDQRDPTICVLLTSPTGVPVREANVRLRGENNGTKQTDASGVVEFELPASGPLNYVFELEFFGKTSCAIKYCPPDARRIGAEIHVVVCHTVQLWGTNVCLPVIDATDCDGFLQVVLDAVVAGYGTGAPCQRESLPAAPIAGSQLKLFTLENNQWRTWTRRDTFCSSGRNDAHFLLDPQAGTVQFGDGERGRVVPENALMLALYSITCGSAGNLKTNTINSIATSRRNEITLDDVQKVQSWLTLTNPLPAGGGADVESLDSMTNRAVNLVQSTERAVTLDDYERLARQTPGMCLARVEARANQHPAFQCVNASGVVTVLVLPYLPADRPAPTEELLSSVSTYLERRRVLGTRVEVVGPRYVEVTVRTKVRACPRVDPIQLAGRIRKALDEFFHPLTGGPQENGWPFGRDVYRSEVLQVIDETPGTDYVESLELEADGEKTCGNVCVPRNGLVDSSEHEIQVTRPI